MDSPVILDWGSHSFKAGTAANFPNEVEPQVVLPAAVRASDYATSLAGELDLPQGTQQVVDQGRISSWQGFQALTHHCLYSQVCLTRNLDIASSYITSLEVCHTKHSHALAAWLGCWR